MKKIFRVFIFFSLLLLSACSFINDDMRTIDSPNITKTPINGTWTVTKIIFVKDENDYFKYKDNIGRDVIFSNKGFILDGYYFDNPKIKAKIVDANKYLEKNYQISQSDLGIETDKITVVNLYNSKDLVYQVLKVDEDTCYLYMDGVFKQLSRISDDVSDEEFEQIKKTEQSELVNLKEKLNENSNDSAILIGLKSANGKSYNSFYIKFKGEEIESVNKLKGLRVPKNSSVDSVASIDGNEKLITMTDAEKVLSSSSGENESFEIMYVSDDYISIHENSKDKDEERLIFKHTDDLQKDTSIPLSRLIENGDGIFRQEAEKLGEVGYVNDLNFGVKRENGKFSLVGLMVYRNSELKNTVFDLNIDINRIIETSELAIPFETIKSYIPSASDAVMSLNNRFIVTVENNTLNIYNIVNTQLGSNRVYSVEIDEDSEIVQVEKFVGVNSVQIKEKLGLN